MSEFTDDQITAMAQVAEKELAIEIKAIIERFSFPVTQGQAEFTLSSDVTDIMRVFWKGKRLYGSRSTPDMINSNSVPYSSEQGEPVEYVTTFLGNPVIRLYPSPNETLVSGSGDLWSVTNITNSFIVECAIAPNFYSSTLRVPEYIRRQYVKDYVLYRLFKKESKAMDSKAASYFNNKFKMDKQEHKIIKEQLLKCITRSFKPAMSSSYKIARPVLPSQFGVICE